MTHLSDLFDLADLNHALQERMVVARKHPSCDLTILNYTERCQYERGLWNPVTLACRGLIHDGLGQVVARPFRKFFNYGDATGGEFSLTDPVTVTDKVDGSLGILYPVGQGYAVATRGAFESEQAKWATAWWDRNVGSYRPPDGMTVLTEIVYPENRIVLDYGAREGLVLLGAVDIAMGHSVGPESGWLKDWPFERAATFPYATLSEALDAPQRPNAEGLVIHFIDSDERLKLKQADYVALHKIVTGLNERTVWQHLLDGKPVEDLLTNLPDEFHGWVREVAARLSATVERNAAEVECAYSTILADLPPDHTRKDFALLAKALPIAGHLFARADGKDYRRRLWLEVQPAPRLGPNGIAPTEEAA